MATFPAPPNAPANNPPDAGSGAELDESRYLALRARDARFDGRFFTGVTSTGIYCRPVCKVRTPKRENCQFFAMAAQAEAAGFRPCLRCRPELAPGAGHDTSAPWSTQDASVILARQAASYLQTHIRLGETGLSMSDVADHMGVTDRHLRRIFAAHWGISPLQYLQTHRLLNAKQLLTDTRLPVAQIALLSGFGSQRRFQAAFVAQYRLQPSALRKSLQRPDALATATPTGMGKPTNASAMAGMVELRLGYRPPYNLAAMLGFLHLRAIDAVEAVDLSTLTWARTLCLPHQNTCLQGWIQARFSPEAHCVLLQVSESLAPALPAVMACVRAALDLDADPQAIDACLLESFPGTEGMRVPGTVDGFELAVRAILGQQVTVAAARTLTTRLVNALGKPLNPAVEKTPNFSPPTEARASSVEDSSAEDSRPPPLHRLFPTASDIAETPADELGALGIVRQRQTALIALAQAVVRGDLNLQPTAQPEVTLARLQSIPGIGPWTAQYIAMRALRWPDAFPSGDVALQNALGVRQERAPAKAAEEASKRWKPWRSYAVIRAWKTLVPNLTSTTPSSLTATGTATQLRKGTP